MTIESQHNNTKRNDEISLKELISKLNEWWCYLLSKWYIILGFCLLGAVLGFTYACYKKPIYTATTTFVLEEEKTGGGLGSLAGLASMAGVDLGGGGGGIFQGDNILELYKSRTMIEKTLLTEVDYQGRNQLLIDVYIDFNKLREKWDLDPKLKGVLFRLNDNQHLSRVQDSILGTIVEDVNKNYLIVAKPDKKLSIIKADVLAKDEFFAKTFNSEIVNNVNEFYIKTKTKKTLQNVKILQHKTDSVRAVMNGAIYNAVAVADATPNLNPTRQIQRAAPAQREQFSAETNKTVLGEMVKNLEMTKMSLLKETPLIQVIDRPILPLHKDYLSTTKGSLIGSLLVGFLTVLVLIGRKLFRELLAD